MSRSKCSRRLGSRRRRAAASVLAAEISLTFIATPAIAQVLLDDHWSDGSRTESKRPAEAAVWAGRASDISVTGHVLGTKLGDASQKIWTYFTDGEPVTLAVGQKLTASVSFIPRGNLAESTSRSLRIGLFNDPTSPRVETDVNNDGGGEGAPWTDATGYAVQVLVTGGGSTSTKPFDLGKRMNLKSNNLLGTSGDYLKKSGGTPVTMKLDTEYRVELAISRESETKVVLTSSLFQGTEQLATFSVSDDGTTLSSEAVYDKFDLLYIRLANSRTAADQIDFTNFKVELAPAK